MSDLVSGLVALIAAIPQAVAGAEEADRDRILRALDQARTGLTAIGPNAPTIRAAVERRLAEIERTDRGDEPTRETPTVSTVSVNGVSMAVQGAPLTYEAIVDEMVRRGRRRGLYTVAWSVPRGPSGTLSPGQSVVTQIGMRVSADITDGA